VTAEATAEATAEVTAEATAEVTAEATAEATEESAPVRFFELPGEDEDTRPDKLRAPRLNNLFLDFTNGGMNEPGADATAFTSLGLNYGFPVAKDLAFGALGFQIGGDITLREEERFEADITTGPFIRDVEIGFLGEDVRAGGAVLGDYRHTDEHADIEAVRVIAGVSTRSGHHLGVRGA
jgi:hypothetical protein